MGDFGKSNFKAKSNAKEISVWTLGFSFFFNFFLQDLNADGNS